MKLPSKAHVAIVDGENFIVMQNTGPIFEPKLVEVEKPDLTATNFSAGVKHQDDIGQRKGATQLDELAHAAAAAEWLNHKAVTNKLHDVLIIADPKTMGEMRQHYHSELEKRLTGEITKTMTGETTERIEASIVAA